jgi:hypothetical protein
VASSREKKEGGRLATRKRLTETKDCFFNGEFTVKWNLFDGWIRLQSTTAA